MLPIDVPGEVIVNDDNSISHGPVVHLELEHSLISISKWESKYHKPFLAKERKTPEEMADYIRFMTVTKVKDETVYDRFTPEIIEKINSYIQDSMTATVIKTAPGQKKANPGTFITNEVIYYWLVELGIPFDVEKWHINRLMTLVEVTTEKRRPKKKMPKSEVLRRQSSLNAKRHAKP